MAGTTEVFREAKIDDNDLDLVAEWTRNDFSLGYVFYQRTQVDAIALALTMETLENDVVVVRSEAIWIGNSWFFGGPIPMRVGDKFRFKTTGALAGEDHRAVILLTVGKH